MLRLKPLLALMVFISFCAETTAQLPPIVVEKGQDITRVHTNRLNVIDSPEQFLQIQFFGDYSVKEATPFELLITFHSFAAQPLYTQHSHSQVVAYVDGQRMPLGLAIYDLEYGQQTMNLNRSLSGPASFPEETTLPSGSKLEKAHRLKEILMESLELESISFDSLLRLARAQNVEMELGATRFQLNAIHMDRLQLFVKAITPPSYDAAAVFGQSASPNLNSPSDGNQTPLKETMEWLSSVLSTLTVAPGNRNHIDFEFGALMKCQFKYSETNASGTQKIHFSSDLADLDPEAVLVSETPFSSALRYATKDTALKIKEDSYSQTTYSQHQEKYLYHARTINLKKDGRTRELREAFVHAVNLCQKP